MRPIPLAIPTNPATLHLRPHLPTHNPEPTMSTHQTQLDQPPFNPDILLQDFLRSPTDLFELADLHGLNLEELFAWWEDPATQARVRALEVLAEARRDLRAKLYAAAAIDRLAAISDSPINPVERRRAATTILKHAPTQRSKKQSGRSTDTRVADTHSTDPRATGFGVSPMPVPEPPTTTDASCNPDAPPRPSARGGSPCHDAPTPNSTHETPAPNPTDTTYQPHRTYPTYLPVHSPLTHDAPTTAQGRPESEAGELASIAGQLA